MAFEIQSMATCRGGLLACVVLAVAAPSAGQEAGVQASLGSAAELLQVGRARQALEALRPVEAAEPDNPWLWYYKGSAYLHLGRPYDAMEAYDHALDTLGALGDPDPDLTQLVRRHRRAARQQVFHVSFRTGLSHDSNVSFLGGGVSGPGLISGRADGLFSSRLTVDFAPIANEQETLVVGVRLGHSWHFAIEQFDFQDYGGYVRYSRRLGERWEASLAYEYDMTFLGNEPFLSNHAVAPTLTYQWEPSAAQIRLDKTNIGYRFEARDFLFDTSREFDRDGLAHSVGISQGVKLRPIADWAWTWDVTAGYRFGSAATDGTEFDRFTHDFFVGLDVPLVNPADPTRYLLIPDKELIFHFSADWEIGDYREDSIIDFTRDDRADLIQTYSFVLSQKLIDDLDLGELTLHAFVNWTDANSNVSTRTGDPFTYDKVVSGFQIEWSW